MERTNFCVNYFIGQQMNWIVFIGQPELADCTGQRIILVNKKKPM
jgi:hypothetical protein